MISTRVIAIIQARMGSSRLPGKVLRQLGGQSVLANVIARVRAASTIDDIVVATTTLSPDDVIESEAERLGVRTFRGSESDVLARYQAAAETTAADVVVRVTADCPLLDSAVVDAVVNAFLSGDAECDYASNTLRRTFPRGLDTEVFSRSALEIAAAEALESEEREHVTLFFHNHIGCFKLRSVIDTNGRDLSHHRWTLDTAEDFDFLQRVFAGCAITASRVPSFRDIAAFVEANPEVAVINAKIRQKLTGA